MAAPETAKHLTPETLVDYFDHRLSNLEETEIERHLADCDRCTALARRVRRCSEAWNNWTATTHAAALQAHSAGSDHRPNSPPEVLRRAEKLNSPVKKHTNGNRSEKR